VSDVLDAPNRATVALVSEKVDGLRELTRAGFADLQRQMNSVSDMPVRVARLEERLDVLDEHRDPSAQWASRGPILLAIVSVLSLVGNLLLLTLQH